MLGDFCILYAVAGFFLLVGIGCYFFLRKIKVGVDEHGNEWLERAGGTIVLTSAKARPVAR